MWIIKNKLGDSLFGTTFKTYEVADSFLRSFILLEYGQVKHYDAVRAAYFVTTVD